MEYAILFVFIIVFYIFYSIRSFPLPKFMVGGMQPKERESLDKFIRGVGMVASIFVANQLFHRFSEDLMGGSFISAFLVYIGIFFLLKILIDIFHWKIGTLWVAHLLIYLIWTGIILLMVYAIENLGIDTDTTFGFILTIVLLISLAYWLYARYFHQPWKFSRVRPITQQ